MSGARRWVVAGTAAVGLISAVVVTAVLVPGHAVDTAPALTTTPLATSAPSATTPRASRPATESPESATPSPPETPRGREVPPGKEIAASAPTTLYLPADDPALEIRTELLALTCGYDIPYPTSGPDVWRGFYCTDYALPGTAMPHYGIITGHSTTSAATDTVMNRLLAHGDLVGRTIYLRTEKSGDAWLAYRFTEVTAQPQDKLGESAVWGADGRSTAGQLIFLTCGQQRYGFSEADNVLITATFAGVVDQPSMPRK